MDDIFGILTLVALAAVALLVAVPFLLFSHLGLKAKMRDLEQIVLRNRADLARLLDGSATDGLPHATGVVAHTVAAQDTQRRSPHLPDRQDDHSPAEAVAQVALPSAESSAEPPKAFVFKPDLIDRLTRWLRENWVLAIAAASLVMAGVFMVQYGVEHGLLTPFWRVMGASGFGAALIGAGEYIRRRASDDEGATKYLPSTLSGAGIVVLYAAVFSAAALYGLIGATALLIGLMAVSALALVLGWFHGPFLAAIGIIGACVAPFLTGGSSDSAWAMQYGFAMIAIVALGIDTVKRWAWISVLGLVAPIAATWLLYLITSADLHFLTAGLIITLAAFIIPERNLTPHHAGAAVLDMLLSKGRYRPEFPTRLSFGATLATTVAAVCIVVDANSAGVIWLSFVTLIFLLVATVVWARQATALYDHALIPGVGFLVAIALEGLGYGPLYAAFFHVSVDTLGQTTTGQPMTVWLLLAIGAAGSGLMFLRMNWAIQGESSPVAPIFWALCAASFAPTTVLILEFMWNPGPVLGAYPWALAVIVVAAFMVLLASRTAAGPEMSRPLRTGLFAVGALTLITLSFFLILTKSALTVALAVMVLGTALLDRRYRLPPLTLFIQVAVAIITYRLVIWPGFDWALHFDYGTGHYAVSYLECAFAFVASMGLLAASWWLAQGQNPKTALVLESACWSILGVFLSITLMRAAPPTDALRHWVMGPMAATWAALALTQLYRMQAGGRLLTILRTVLAGIYALLALAAMAWLLLAANPLTEYNEQVAGPPIFDSLALAFLPLAVVFAVGAWKIRHFGKIPRIALIIAASAFSALYVGSEIRRLWRGRDLTVPGFTDAELYSYTLAMLVASVALLFLAFTRRSDLLRKVAMVGVALTVAKVFLIDMSGLSGLIRVFSFMGLGLSLVALAWLNRKMTAQWERKAPAGDPPAQPSKDVE